MTLYLVNPGGAVHSVPDEPPFSALVGEPGWRKAKPSEVETWLATQGLDATGQPVAPEE